MVGAHHLFRGGVSLGGQLFLRLAETLSVASAQSTLRVPSSSGLLLGLRDGAHRGESVVLLRGTAI
jgi:hypothetical protein